ncbi:hypothetical protein AMECASPLE_021130 [Ameca splendens]|uniref:Uncharacterized protein n=1 Tax=Ameca splendens TaxID=208324 RepID=A0ABV1A0B0_9TELE
MFKTVEMTVKSREHPHSLSPHHPQQESAYCGSLQVPRNHSFSGAKLVLTVDIAREKSQQNLYYLQQIKGFG